MTADIEAIESFRDKLGLLAKGVRVEDAYWLSESDDGSDYCRACAVLQIEGLNMLEGRSCTLDGGWRDEGDGCRHCDTCGVMLDYSLTDYGAQSELDHFLSDAGRDGPLTSEDAEHLIRMFDAMELTRESPERSYRIDEGPNVMSHLSILNVGDGDTKISFDPKRPAEREKAARIVTDMLKRGYALLVQVGEKDGEPLYQRVKRFDAKCCEYIIAFEPETPHEPTSEARSAEAKPRRQSRERRLPAEKTHAVAVARSAGG